MSSKKEMVFSLNNPFFPKEKKSSEMKIASVISENKNEQISVSESVSPSFEEKESVSESDSELDELPDFGTVISEVSEDVSDVIDSGEVYHSSSSSSSTGVDGQDADTIAKAIRTMLNGD